MSTEEHEHHAVGHIHNSFGAKYLCTRWDRQHGYWMRLVEGNSDLFPNREIGYETCVSERAVGPNRTYSRDWYNKTVHEHEEPCNCYVCEERGRYELGPGDRCGH